MARPAPLAARLEGLLSFPGASLGHSRKGWHRLKPIPLPTKPECCLSVLGGGVLLLSTPGQQRNWGAEHYKESKIAVSVNILRVQGMHLGISLAGPPTQSSKVARTKPRNSVLLTPARMDEARIQCWDKPPTNWCEVSFVHTQYVTSDSTKPCIVSLNITPPKGNSL